ncbi:DUF3325 domain-containing protein [uncultured Stenotrophomonas sp.]|uniref:DUF3325 domain-containing protein n=1 Tax=uncultured Stenotrophomonas sp. TaxID=165438 RepID=UPI0028E7FFC0|nr:DUF3325 domain-containing protein [uncultured Stenotrophomonas sp.]
MTVLALLLALAGFACLSLAMDRHHRDVFGALPMARRRQLFRLGGWMALLAAVACCIVGWGVAYGVIAGCGIFAVGAALPLLWLSYRTAPTARPTPRAPSKS